MALMKLYLQILVFCSLIFASCPVMEPPEPVEIKGRIIVTAPYSAYSMDKVHIYDSSGKLLGSADPEKVTVDSGAEEIHWTKKLDIVNGTPCTIWVELSTPIYPGVVYYNEGQADLLTAGSAYDLKVGIAQTPIVSEADLRRIGTTDTYAMDGRYVLVHDIVLHGEWEPIGRDSLIPFSGVFNGHYNTIRGLTLAGDSRQYIGLFGYLKGATVQRLVVEISGAALAVTTATDQSVGVVAGYAEDSNFDEIIVQGPNKGLVINSESGSDLRVGGIVGSFVRTLAGTSAISRSALMLPIAVKGSVTSFRDRSCVGGIAGLCRSEAANSQISINKCYSIKRISMANDNGWALVGGIAGYYKFSGTSTPSAPLLQISESYNAGNISAIALTVYAGGILGFIESGSSGTVPGLVKIDRCVASNSEISIGVESSTTNPDYGFDRLIGGLNSTTWQAPNSYGLDPMKLEPVELWSTLHRGEHGLDVQAVNLIETWYIATPRNWDFPHTWEWDVGLKRPVFAWQ